MRINIKKIIVCIICTVMFFQNFEIAYATEKTDVIETFEDEEIIENEEISEDEEIVENEETSEDEEIIENEEII